MNCLCFQSQCREVVHSEAFHYFQLQFGTFHCYPLWSQTLHLFGVLIEVIDPVKTSSPKRLELYMHWIFHPKMLLLPSRCCQWFSLEILSSLSLDKNSFLPHPCPLNLKVVVRRSLHTKSQIQPQLQHRPRASAVETLSLRESSTFWKPNIIAAEDAYPVVNAAKMASQIGSAIWSNPSGFTQRRKSGIKTTRQMHMISIKLEDYSFSDSKTDPTRHRNSKAVKSPQWLRGFDDLPRIRPRQKR